MVERNSTKVSLVGMKDLRKAAGLTKAEVARLLEVDYAAVCRWESGETLPRAAKLPVLADMLDCTIDALFARKIPQATDKRRTT